MDITIPTANSDGAKTVFAIKSDSIKRRIPTKAVTGINLLCFIPTNCLAIWGAINPIKPIFPATHTQELINPTQANNNFLFSLSKSIPKLTILLSSNWK